jgi:hypothetical protein
MEETKARIMAHITRLGLQRDAMLKAILESRPTLQMLERLEAALAAQAGAPEHKPQAAGPERVIDVEPLPIEPRPWLSAFIGAPLITRPAVASIQDELRAMREPRQSAPAPGLVSALADEVAEVCRLYRESEANG